MKNILFIFCLLTFGSTVYSQQTQSTTPPKFNESFIYFATREACAKLPARTIKNTTHLAHDRLRAGYFPSDNFTKILTQIRQETFAFGLSLNFAAISPTARQIKFSPSFARALHECYGPDDQVSHLFFEAAVDKSSSAGSWVASAVTLAQMYAGGKVISASFKYLKNLSFLQTAFSDKYAAVRKWSKRTILTGFGVYVGAQVYEARDAVYSSMLLVLNDQEAALEKYPRVKVWLKGELRAQGLASDVDDMIDALTEEVEMVEDIVIESTKAQIVELYAKRSQLTDPEAIAIVDKGIATFQARLAERQALKNSKPKKTS